ncbi:SCO family protein [Skermanella rosea]|nr:MULTISPECIES: SCO family protein [Skermanella]UEM06719.1 SCO family protein [Skermanella rosea]
MRTKFFLKSSGRAAVLATLLMGGTALYFGTLAMSASATQDQGAHGAAVQAAEPQAGGGHGSGHGSSEQANPEEAQSGSQGSGHGSGYGAHSGWPEPRQLGGDFSLTDHTGRKVTLADFKGKAAAFYFGYAQCGDICPIIGTKLGMAVDLMGDKADQINIAMVSVDDRNDGPKELAAFVAKQHPRLIGLSGTRGEIYDIAAKFRVRRDYVTQNQVAKEGEEQAEAHSGGAHASGAESPQTSHEAASGQTHEGAAAVQTAGSTTEAQAKTTTPRETTPGQRIRIRSASDDATRLHNMAMAHTTHIYLLNKNGQVVRYIYPSMTPENLAKRLTDLVDEG